MPIILDEEEEETKFPPLPKEKAANQPGIASFFMRTPTKPKERLQKMIVARREVKLQE